MNSDEVKKFWEDYQEKDYFDRREALTFMLEDLVTSLNHIPSEEMKAHLILSVFQGYIDDIIEVNKEASRDAAIEAMGQDA